MNFVFVVYCRPTEKNLELVDNICKTYHLSKIDLIQDLTEVCKLNPKINKIVSDCKNNNKKIPNRILNDVFMSNVWKIKEGKGIIILNYPYNEKSMEIVSNYLSQQVNKLHLIIDIQNNNNIIHKKLKFFEITNNLINNFYNIFTQEGDFIKNLYDNIFYPINGDQSEKLLFDAVCNVIEINTSLKRPESGIYAILKKSLI